MVLKAYKEQTFKANVKFDDESVKEVTFRLPRNTDIYVGEDGNTNKNTIATICNMAKPFDKPVQVEIEDGSILNVTTLKELSDLGVNFTYGEVIQKWFEKKNETEKEKEELVKKSKSAGNSTPKAIPPKVD